MINKDGSYPKVMFIFKIWHLLTSINAITTIINNDLL